MSISDQTIVVHLSSDDQYKAAKAIRFAKKSLDYAERSVMYVSVQGIKILQRSTGGFTMPGTDTNSLDALREYIKDGGQIFLGKECLKIFNIHATDILAGCEPADAEIMFKYLLADSTKMISW